MSGFYPMITGRTRLAGVIGCPVAHSLSPAMQNAALRYCGVDAVYVPLSVEAIGLNPLLKTLRAVKALGVNVTIPYKEAVIPFLDRLDPQARRIGAVNTIVFDRGRMTGYNTDGPGFLACFGTSESLRGRRAVLVGAGGAGRAVAVSLASSGVKELTIAEIDPRRLTGLLRHLTRLGFKAQGTKPGSTVLQAAAQSADLAVNATPLGLKPEDPEPLSLNWLPLSAKIMDLAYGRQPTAWLAAAKQRGHKVINGQEMLLRQGAMAFTLWTGKKAPLTVMRRALAKAG